MPDEGFYENTEKNYTLTKMEDYFKLHERTVKNAKEEMALV